VVDVGCGAGTEIGYLATKGWRAVGVDLSGAAPNRAKHEHAGVPLVQADVFSLPFPPAVFDLVVDRGCFTISAPRSGPTTPTRYGGC
jgi:SAM-dependent methyltransferase